MNFVPSEGWLLLAVGRALSSLFPFFICFISAGNLRRVGLRKNDLQSGLDNDHIRWLHKPLHPRL